MWIWLGWRDVVLRESREADRVGSAVSVRCTSAEKEECHFVYSA